MDRDELVLLGRITDAHGLKGEVKIASFTSAPEAIGAYGPLSTSDGSRSFMISSFRIGNGGVVIARLSGVADRDAAEKLKGQELYVKRDALPEPEQEEYYHSDLIGLSARSPSGEPIGEILAVHNFGAGDLLEIRLLESGRTELVPFDEANVPKIDLREGCATIAYSFQEDEADQEDGAEDEAK